MIRVVMMTLVRWDDRGEEMNQEEADQDVDEVSEEADSRGKVMRSQKNDW